MNIGLLWYDSSAQDLAVKIAASAQLCKLVKC